MKNIIASIILAICLFIGTTNANACENQLETPVNPAEIVITTEIVDDVFYENGWYYIVTQEDDEGGQWVLEIEEGAEDDNRLYALGMKYVGQAVDVQYYGDYELLSWYALEEGE